MFLPRRSYRLRRFCISRGTKDFRQVIDIFVIFLLGHLVTARASDSMFLFIDFVRVTIIVFMITITWLWRHNILFRFLAFRRGSVAERLHETKVLGAGLRLAVSSMLAEIGAPDRTVYHGRVRRPFYHDVYRYQHGVYGIGPRRDEQRTCQCSYHWKLRASQVCSHLPMQLRMFCIVWHTVYRLVLKCINIQYSSIEDYENTTVLVVSLQLTVTEALNVVIHGDSIGRRG